MFNLVTIFHSTQAYCCCIQCLQVESPLNTAQKLILLSAERFDTEFSLWNYVCLVYVTLIVTDTSISA